MMNINPGIVIDCFDNELIIANLETGIYYSLSGSLVSLLADMPFANINEEIDKFLARYGLSDDEAQRDSIMNLWKELVEEKIVMETPDPTKMIDQSLLKSNGQFKKHTFFKYADLQDLLTLDPVHEVSEDGWESEKKE